MKLSISQLAEASGMSTRTVSRRLEPLEPEIRGHAHLYEISEAMPLLFGHPVDGKLDLSQERAALAREQTRLTELKRRELEGLLISEARVLERWTQIVSHVRARLLSLPSSIAATCDHADKVTIEDRSRDLVYQALAELAEAPDYG